MTACTLLALLVFGPVVELARQLIESWIIQIGECQRNVANSVDDNFCCFCLFHGNYSSEGHLNTHMVGFDG